MNIFVGVDGGGTNTRAVLVDRHGDILGKGNSGPSNYNDIGLTGASKNIKRAIEDAKMNCGEKNLNLSSIYLGLGGVLSEEDKNIMRQKIYELGLGFNQDDIYVENDMHISLAGGLLNKPGVSLIVGTGSVCFGRDVDGNTLKAGGWGHLIDDVGSGYYLGIEALKALVRAVDGRGVHSELTERVYKELGLENINQIMKVLYYDNFGRKEIAGLTKLLISAAENRDKTALQIIKKSVNKLAILVETVVTKLNFSEGEVLVTTSGGLTESGPVFNTPLKEAILKKVPDCRLVDPMMSPLLGAALLVLENNGLLNESVISNWTASC